MTKGNRLTQQFRMTPGAIVLYYVLSIIMLLLATPDVLFDVLNTSAEGRVIAIKENLVQVDFYNNKGELKSVKLKNEKDVSIRIGDVVEVLYIEKLFFHAYCPSIQKVRVILMNVVYIIMSVSLIYFTTQDLLYHLRNKKK